MLLSIFTPLYNRARYLNRIYKSLIEQNIKDFEWIIIDDGSSDNPKEILKKLQEKSPFTIEYQRQCNRGKHVAINNALKIAKGELFLILDSDDILTDDAISSINYHYEKIKNNQNIGGVVGRKLYDNGDLVGNSTFDELISDTFTIRFKLKTYGDFTEVFKTEVLKQYPFPEIENEKFCPEALIWNRVSANYKLLFFNKGLQTIQYLEDGLSNKIVKIRMTSPVASMLTYSELTAYDIPLKEKIKAYINFWRFSFNSNFSFLKKLSLLQNKFGLIFYPLGFLMYLRDIKKYS